MKHRDKTERGVEALARKRKSNQLTDKQRSLISHHAQKSPVTEQFRTLRTNIQFSSIDKVVKKILISSSGPAEGKSTVIANLGVVMAQQGKRVLLIDSDLRKPTVHFTFQLENTFGLTSVLTRAESFESAVQETAVENLEVLTSGPVPPNPSELIGSRSMELFLSQIEKDYDYILFDAPPINVVTDGQILATKTDGVVLVIRSGKTEKEAAIKAVELLKKTNSNIIGTVLNDREMKEDTYYYYAEGK
ncbi:MULTISPECIES: CpsD/CapB family tyrosine-protein kinase [Alteribacter]|uniref:non-specific protein-tyrosine kinase n=1 Tax=Alteribacter keqinensis TaxID=2483800 RepID=A0A3M7TQJ9_9BACI|nr:MULTISPECIES: CpsD/CapB family tyrosine-protein kinase [Alteribacter]MBM7095669.1 CpsD/CapB family tyrosine-protein kinase [Alteribacter salitolerans]RNA67745.1 polysaccharide biosynthesis tyrosine autokinase [Alteribacter keqinensis]